VRSLDAEHVEQPDDVPREVVECVRERWPVAVPVPDEVDGTHAEVATERAEVAAVGLGVATGAVQEQQRRTVAGLQYARAHPGDVVEALLDA
jgi:hypothetical protein